MASSVQWPYERPRRFKRYWYSSLFECDSLSLYIGATFDTACMLHTAEYGYGTGMHYGYGYACTASTGTRAGMDRTS